MIIFFFFFSSRRRHTRSLCDWSSDVCSSDLFEPGGLVASAAWKVLPPGRPAGYWESYKSEIAAYELDKLLELHMVPVAVEKRWKGETAAAILWLAPIHPWKEMESRPKPAKWVRQVVRMKMFDNFI